MLFKKYLHIINPSPNDKNIMKCNIRNSGDVKINNLCTHYKEYRRDVI